MENNHFEKQVQETLDGLTIEPSEGAWTAIESRIGTKKSKRRFLWFFMLGLLLLGGTGYLFLVDGKSSNEIISQVAKPEMKINTPDQEELADVNQIAEANSQSETQVHSNPTIGASEIQSPGSKLLIQSGTHPEKKNEEKKNEEKKNEEKENLYKTEQVDLANDKKAAVIPQVRVKETNVLSEDKAIVDKAIVAESDFNSNDEVVIAQKDADTSSAKPVSEIELLFREQSQHEKEEFVVQEKNDLAKILKGGKIKISPSSRKRWEIGVTFSAAKAYTGDGLALGFATKKSDMFYDPQNSFGNAVSRPGPVVDQTPIGPASTPENSIGFKGGIVFMRQISANLTFVTGLGYTYYTNTMLVGSEITSEFFNSAGILTSYRNNFHFADLPFTAQFHLNRKNNIPLGVSVGVNLSRLVASDAVQYKRGNYIVDHSLFNKTQFSFNVGMSASFFKKLSVGPFYQYGVNSLAEEGLYGKKHLNFLGIKADYILRKNK